MAQRLQPGWPRGPGPPQGKRGHTRPGPILRQWVIDGPAKQGLDRANWTYEELADHLFKTKGIAVACDEDGVVAVDVAEGQRHDAPLAEPVLAKAAETLGGFDEVLGDKGFDSDAIRKTVLQTHDALPVIPNKANRKDPWPWDATMAETYKQQNRIERAFAKAKQFWRFATC